MPPENNDIKNQMWCMDTARSTHRLACLQSSVFLSLFAGAAKIVVSTSNRSSGSTRLPHRPISTDMFPTCRQQTSSWSFNTSNVVRIEIVAAFVCQVSPSELSVRFGQGKSWTSTNGEMLLRGSDSTATPSDRSRWSGQVSIRQLVAVVRSSL